MEVDKRIGKRVRLVRTTDSFTALRPGDEGVVVAIDDWGTLDVKWDNGSNLGLIPGEDKWTILDDEVADDRPQA